MAAATVTRRRLSIVLHWSSFSLLLLVLAVPDSPSIALAFCAAGLGFGSVALVRGLMSGPGPALGGLLRPAHPWMHRGLYATLALVAGLTGMAGFGTGPDPETVKSAQVALVAASMLHGIFHLWRHTALGDGALRRILPRALHGLL